MPHAERPHTSGTNDEDSGTPDFFPPVGNFNAVVPLSEIDADSEIKSDSQLRVTAPAESRVVRAASRRREQDEQEEATLVPARAARKARASRRPGGRPSWPVMIAALALSLMAGLAAGVYLIKSVKPVELQAPASMTEDASRDTAAAPETSGPQPAQVASESRPEARPLTEKNLDSPAPEVDVEVNAEKTGRGVTAPKRVAAAVAERTPERPARKVSPSSADTPATTEAVRPRRATPAGESAPARRAPERSLPVSSPPPSSAKSKRVIQWP